MEEAAGPPVPGPWRAHAKPRTRPSQQPASELKLPHATDQAPRPGRNQQATTFIEKVLPPRRLRTYAAELCLTADLWTVQGWHSVATPRTTGLPLSSLNSRAKPGPERASGSPRSQPIGDRAGTLNCRTAVAWQRGAGALGGWAAARLRGECTLRGL